MSVSDAEAIQLGRIVRVTAYRQLSDVSSDPRGYFGQLGNGVEILGGNDLFRIQFKVKRTNKKEPNTCEITITNLAEVTREALVQRPLRVRLEAGYGETYRHLFVGDIRPGSFSERVGSDWETKLVLADGGRSFDTARVRKSYKPGTPYKVIVEDAARSMGLELPADVGTLPALASGTVTGEVLTGWASDELDRLLAQFGMSYSIQDGVLFVTPDGVLRPGEAYLIDQDDGMIGSPKVGTPDKKGHPPITKVKNTLYPELVPGCRIELRSKSIVTATYGAITVEHEGDTKGGSWHTEIEMRPA